MKRFAFIFMLMLTLQSGIAEELSLEQCISIAVSENDSLQSQQYAIDSAQADKNSMFWSFFPTTQVDVKMIKLDFVPDLEPLISPETAAMLPPGLNFDLEPSDKMRTLDINIAQPITPLWSIYKGHSAKEMVVEIEKLKKALTKRQLINQITALYYNHLMLNKMNKLLKEGKQQLIRYETKAQHFVDAGMSDKRAVLKIQIERAKLDKELMNMQTNKNTIQTALALFLNRQKDSFTLKDRDVTISVLETDLSTIQQIQHEKRREIKILDKSQQLYETLTDIAIQPLIPTLALTAGYTKNWDAIPGFQPEGTIFIGGVASWNIGFDWLKNYNTYKKTKSQELKTKLANIDMKKKMTLQVTTKYGEVLVKEKEIEIARREVTAAKENLRIEESKYAEKMTTETDLLNSSLNLRKARTSLLSAQFQYHIVRHELATLIGISADELE